MSTNDNVVDLSNHSGFNPTEEELYRLHSFLVYKASKRETCTYTECAVAMQLRDNDGNPLTAGSYMGQKVGRSLDILNTWCMRKDLALLSSIVNTKATDRPGNGYFIFLHQNKFTKTPDPTNQENLDFLEEEIESVYKWYDMRIVLPMSDKGLHIIAKEGINTPDLEPVKGTKNLYSSGYWKLSDQQCNKYIGGNIFFHTARKSHSFLGGKLIGFERHDDRVKLLFQHDDACSGVLTDTSGWAQWYKFV